MIQNLVRQGLVEIRRGRGTLSLSPGSFRNSASSQAARGHADPGTDPTARVVSREIVSAHPLVAEKLGVPPGATVVKTQRVRLSDGEPLSFDETYLPENLGRRVMTDDLAREPIFTLLEERYDTPLVEAEYVLEAAAAEPDVAAALEISGGRPDLRDRADLLHFGTWRRGLRKIALPRRIPSVSRRAWPGGWIPRAPKCD